MKGLNPLLFCLEWLLIVGFYSFGINSLISSDAYEGVWKFISATMGIMLFLISIKLYHLFRTDNGGNN